MTFATLVILSFINIIVAYLFVTAPELLPDNADGTGAADKRIAIGGVGYAFVTLLAVMFLIVSIVGLMNAVVEVTLLSLGYRHSVWQRASARHLALPSLCRARRIHDTRGVKKRPWISGRKAETKGHVAC